MTAQAEIHASGDEHQGIIREVLVALKGLRYGSVEITVHDGRVAQIDRRERRRFLAPPGSAFAKASEGSRPLNGKNPGPA